MKKGRTLVAFTARINSPRSYPKLRRNSLSGRLPTSPQRPDRLGRFGFRSVLIEELSQFLRHGAAELLGIDDRYGAPIIPRHVMTDADGDEFDR